MEDMLQILKDSNIVYRTHHEIDKEKWDHRVEHSESGLIYTRSYYLDALCQWDALIQGDYDYIMPLPRRSKWFIKYIYTPSFAGQLGIIGEVPISKSVLIGFINAIPPSFLYIDILMNEYNGWPENEGSRFSWRTNFILPLDDQYEDIYQRYSKDARKNLRKQTIKTLHTEENISIKVVFEMYKIAYGRLFQGTNVDFEKFQRLVQTLINHHNGFTIGVRDETGSLVASAFFAIDNKRIYYLLGAPTIEGKKRKAIHFLIDSLIRKYSGSHLLFDFEGSDIDSVASFYKKFGPLERQYAAVKINKLPLLLKWLKY